MHAAEVHDIFAFTFCKNFVQVYIFTIEVRLIFFTHSKAFIFELYHSETVALSKEMGQLRPALISCASFHLFYVWQIFLQ